MSAEAERALAPNGGSARTRFARGLAVLRAAAPPIVCVLIWLTHMILPGRIAESSRDPSWSTALGYAVSHGWQAGLDYVFTFGPLGYFSTDAYVPDLYWIKIILWEGVFKLLIAAVLTRVALGIPGILNGTLFVFLLLIQPPDPDAYAFLSIAAIAMWTLERDAGRVPAAVSGLALLAMLSLVKFSYSAPAAACALAIAASHGRIFSWKAGVLLVFAFLALISAAWVIAGQALPNLTTYFRRSIQIASGYSEGMSLSAPSRTVAVALATAVALVFLAIVHASTSPRARSRFLWSLAFVAVLWIAHKAGLVRAQDHTPIYFGFTLAAAFLPRASGRTRPWRAVAMAARLLCVTLSLVGLGWASEPARGGPFDLVSDAGLKVARNSRAILHPSAFRADCEARLEIERTWSSFPRTRAAVGAGTIDMVSSRQGLLFVNDLNWRPRPVFQSYATFTPELMELNASFFRSERASDFILFRLESLDGRLGTLDDALALRVITRDYAPVLIEKGFLLLQRAPRSEPPDPPRVVLEKEIAFGESLDLRGLEGRCHLLRLDIRYTAWGRIRTFLDRAPPLFLQIESDNGRTHELRIIPGMMRAGVIIDPLIRTQVEFRNWYLGEEIPRPVAVRVRTPRFPSMYRAEIGVAVLRADDIIPRPHPELDAPPAAQLFESPPLEIRAAMPLIHAYVCEEEAIVLPAPSEMRYEPAAGSHVLRVEFGFAAQAWLTGGTDGGTFSAILRRPNEQDVVLFQTFLDPVNVTKDRNPQTVEVRFRLDTPASLILRTDPGPKGDATADWTGWTAVSLK